MQVCTVRKVSALWAGGGEEGGRERDRDETREGENEQKHIREYGCADELPPGRFHHSRCYPRWMTMVRAGGREPVPVRPGERPGRERMDGRGEDGWVEEDMAEERTTDVAHYANVSRYVVQRKQTEPEAPTPYTTALPPLPLAIVVATPLLRRPLHK